MPTELTASVVVVTYNRPEYVRTCLEHLAAQTLAPLETVVVDASPHRLTEAVVAEFPGVLYLRNELGMGYMATSRAIGVDATRGDVVAFVDDDAYAEPEWLAALLEPYADPAVGAVGGRARNGIPGEEEQGVDQVGLLLPDGQLTGNFAADTRHDVEVDHLIGANMSYRRTALDAIGGIHDHWPGTCLREDADTGLRLGQAGWKVVYTPFAVVFHVGGAYAKGRRFDLRYTYYGARNHVVLLRHAFGARDVRTRRYVARQVPRQVGAQVSGGFRSLAQRERNPYQRVRGFGGGLTRAAVTIAGTLVGLGAPLTAAASRKRVAAGGPAGTDAFEAAPPEEASPDLPRVKLYTRSMNKNLYHHAMSLLDVPWPRERLVGTSATGYLVAAIMDEQADYVVNLDEDAFVLDSRRLEDLVNHVIAGSYINAGMPDGGLLTLRGGNPAVTNACFTVMHTKRIRDAFDQAAIDATPLDDPGSMARFPRQMLRAPWRQTDEIEPYYRLLLWMCRLGDTLYLDARTRPDGLTSEILDHRGRPLLWHTWFSRDYGRDLTQTRRIVAVIEGAARQAERPSPVRLAERARLAITCSAHMLKARLASRT